MEDRDGAARTADPAVERDRLAVPPRSRSTPQCARCRPAARARTIGGRGRAARPAPCPLLEPRLLGALSATRLAGARPASFGLNPVFLPDQSRHPASEHY